jgi:DNA polymerase-3 subunit chi
VSEIAFYHLTRSSLAQALPALLGRTLTAGERAVVVCRDAAGVAALDQALWDCAEPNWLPHGTDADGDAELQPIWLATDDAAPNGARFLFLVDGAGSGRLDAFARVFDLFDGNDESAVQAARIGSRSRRGGRSRPRREAAGGMRCAFPPYDVG